MAGAATLRYKIRVPIFDAGYSLAPINGNHGLGGGVFFDTQSTDAFMPVSNAFAYPGTVTRMGSELFSIGGISRAEVNPTSAASQTGLAHFIDGQFVAVNFEAAVGWEFWSKPQSPFAGIYNPLPLNSYKITGPNLFVLSGPMPGIYLNNNVIISTWSDLTIAIKLMLLGPNGITLGTGYLNQDPSYMGTIMTNCRWPGGTTDNAMYFPPHPGHHNTQSVWLWNSGDFNAAAPIGNLLDPISFDNANLQTPWAAAANYSVKSTTNGVFMVCIATNGTGPTGNYSEILRVAPDWSYYDIIQPVAQDATSAAALTSTGPSVWQGMIDSNGIFWFNPGDVANAGRIFNSYSAIPGIPTLYFGNVTPFGLPCANYCNPLTFH